MSSRSEQAIKYLNGRECPSKEELCLPCNGSNHVRHCQCLKRNAKTKQKKI